MMEKIGRTWSLMGACWQLLKEEKKILFFPFISATCCLGVVALFALPMFLSGNWRPPAGDAKTAQLITYYGLWFLCYYCNYLVVVFFNVALISCAMTRMSGQEPTIAGGLQMAAARLPLIAGWAFLAATVGLILRVIEDRSDKIGEIVAGILGTAWTVVTFLVVPILVVERKGPFGALKESTVLVKKTWGEQLVSGFSFSTIFFLLSLLAVGLVIVGVFSQNVALMAVCIGIAIVYFILLALIQSALEAIFQAALYLYARNGQVPDGFDKELLSGALIQR
jgi:hypothetical protein